MACTGTNLFLLGVAKVDCLEHVTGKCSLEGNCVMLKLYSAIARLINENGTLME